MRRESPAARPREISSRSANSKAGAARRGSGHGTPPVCNTKAGTDGPRLPSRRASAAATHPAATAATPRPARPPTAPTSARPPPATRSIRGGAFTHGDRQGFCDRLGTGHAWLSQNDPFCDTGLRPIGWMSSVSNDRYFSADNRSAPLADVLIRPNCPQGAPRGAAWRLMHAGGSSAPPSPLSPSPWRRWSPVRPRPGPRPTNLRDRPCPRPRGRSDLEHPQPHDPTITGLTENRTAHLLFRPRRSLESALDPRG
jgi:hypothetical protein